MASFNYGKVQIEWLGHASFRISSSGKVIYIDPFVLDENPYPADLVLITHDHYDHCAVENIKKILKQDTIVVAPQNCLSKLAFVPQSNLRLMGIKDSINCSQVEINTIPAYNINKFRGPEMPFHPRNYGLGYIFNFEGVKIYHAGDTDFVPEMRELADQQIDVALLPVGGTYTMDAREAAEAVKAIKPQVAIPMHWGNIVGTRADAEKFKELVGDAQVIIL